MSSQIKTLAQYIESLNSNDPEERISAASALGEIGNDRGVSPLINALSHSDENLRREAARALKEIGNKRAIEPLNNALEKDPSPEVRAEVAYALSYFSDFNVDSLLNSLNDEHYLVRQNAAFALGKLKSRKATKLLIATLEKDDNYNVREKVAWALGELKDKKALEPLLKALEDNYPSVRKIAAYALGKLGNISAVKSLKTLLLRKDESKEAAWALAKILKKKDAINTLKDAYKKMKKENNINDCIDICEILYELDKELSEKLFQEILDDESLSLYHNKIKSFL